VVLGKEHGATSGKALHIIKGHGEDEARIICHAYERSQDRLGGMRSLFLLFCPDKWPVLVQRQVVLFLMWYMAVEYNLLVLFDLWMGVWYCQGRS